MLFSRAVRSMQVLWTVSVGPESELKTLGLWGERFSRVFRPRATEQWECDLRDERPLRVCGCISGGGGAVGYAQMSSA